MELAQVLLRGDSTLTAGERELIAAYVSRQNECEYCAGSHGATAAALLPGGGEQVAAVLAGAAGDASVLAGEAGAAGDASVLAGEAGDASVLAGAAGDASVLAGDAAVLAGEAGDASVLDGAAGDAAVSAKLRALLDIAGLVRVDGRLVSAEAVAAARAEGASDLEIHDTVLIAAAFCMFNRYVDGLATAVPDDPAEYQMSAAHLVAHGYRVPR
jgi:AhpD family alkylhydroperoxidase